jgi:hypothetical protein
VSVRLVCCSSEGGASCSFFSHYAASSRCFLTKGSHESKWLICDPFILRTSHIKPPPDAASLSRRYLIARACSSASAWQSKLPFNIPLLSRRHRIRWLKLERRIKVSQQTHRHIPKAFHKGRANPSAKTWKRITAVELSSTFGFCAWPLAHLHTPRATLLDRNMLVLVEEIHNQ